MKDTPRYQPNLSANALRTLETRYLRKDHEGRPLETPADMYLRVARHVAGAELDYGLHEPYFSQLVEQFYDMMARGLFLPNSPTLMNAGRSLGMLSACFVLPVEDSIEGIFDSVKQTAQIQKAGGGTGFSFDRLRPSGDYIASSGGRTSGPISFWRVFAEATRAIQQGAFRRGANMGMMSITHPDVLKFITAKSDPTAFENFNISIKVSRTFMQQLADAPDRPHQVINPHDGRRYWLPRGLNLLHYQLQDLLVVGDDEPGDCYTHGDVWQLIVSSAWATGEPGLCFIDRMNDDNPTPHVGRIEATNPCGEQPLLDYEACNLGSVNLSAFVGEGKLDEDALARTIELGVRFLDDVVDVNNYVVGQIARTCRDNRKIGLGVMGLADAMFKLGIRYDSDEGIDFGRRVAELFSNAAYDASERLGRTRSCFPNWQGSRWQQRGRDMRNAAVTTVAPTGTLSILAGCTGGIEPAFALAFYRRILGGREMLEVNEPFRRYAESRGFWSDELAGELASGRGLREIAGIDDEAASVFVTAHEIAPHWHVRMQAAFQECVDGAISKTINLPHDAPVEEVDRVYHLAYQLGCKGVTVYRDRCREYQPMGLERLGNLCPRCQAPLGPQIACARCPGCGATLCG
jgi:ribonucleoside-diphosphate reductase alpha chain